MPIENNSPFMDLIDEFYERATALALQLRSSPCEFRGRGYAECEAAEAAIEKDEVGEDGTDDDGKCSE
jgi:hypothetical protein